MKRNILFLFFAFAVTQSQAGKTDSTTWFTHQAGVNATAFIKQYLVFNSNGSPNSISPTQITYKLIYKKKYALRLQGGYTQNQTSNEDPINNFKQTGHDQGLNMRIGFEYRKSFGKRWLAFGGIDVGILKTSTGSTFESTSQWNNYKQTLSSNDRNRMIGPVLGLQYSFNKYLSVHTELTGFYRLYTLKSESTVESNGSSSHTESHIKEHNFTWYEPTLIFITVNF